MIGHECAGIIEEVGSEVKHLLPGDRVALEPGISCWRCNLCKEGRYNLCPDMKFFATPPVHGSLANQVSKCIVLWRSCFYDLDFNHSVFVHLIVCMLMSIFSVTC